MNWKLCLSLWLVTFFFSISAAAIDTSHSPAVPPDRQRWALSYDVIEDPLSQFSVDDIQTAEMTPQFTRVKEVSFSQGLSKSSFWIRILIPAELRGATNLVFEVKYALLDDITLFVPQPDGAYLIKQTGIQIPISRRDMDGFPYMFRLPEVTYSNLYIKVNSRYLIHFVGSLKSAEVFQKEFIFQSTFWGILLGAMATAALFNLFLLISSRDVKYLYYSWFVICSLLIVGSFRGITTSFLGGGFTLWSLNHIFFWIGLAYISGILFIRNIFKVKNQISTINLLFAAGIVSGSILSAIALLTVTPANILASIILMSLCAILPVVAIAKLMSNNRRTGFLIFAAYVPMMTGFLVTVLSVIEIIPSGLLTADAMHIGLVVGIMIFSVGMMDQINVLKRELEVSNKGLKQKNKLLSTEIFERTQAETLLKKSERNYRQIFENIQTPYMELSLTGAVRNINPAFEHLTQYYKSDIIDHQISWMFEPPNRFQSLFEELKNGRIIKDLEIDLKSMDGRIKKILLFAKTIPEEGKVISSFLDITLRKQAEHEVSLLRNQLKNIFDAIPSTIISVNNELNVINWNKTALSRMALKENEAKGRYFTDVYPQLARHLLKIHTAIEGDTVNTYPKLKYQEGKKTRYESIVISPLVLEDTEGAVIKIDDITDQVQIEEVMIQTEKMMSVGGLAAGMAHELNNPLGAIIQSTQNIKRRLSSDLKSNKPAAESLNLDLTVLDKYLKERKIDVFLGAIEQSGERAATIISQMLQFSRQSESKFAPCNLEVLIENVIELAGKHYDMKHRLDFRNITLIRQIEPELPRIPLNRTEIEQVLLNLLINAAWALNSNQPSADQHIIIRASQENGAFLRLEIEDNGHGISENDKKRVFEPFFTTKPVGEGTGLGLSVAYMIITNNHQGSIEVESEPCKGTAFIIRLPIEREQGTEK